jgi:hypothetical protein
MLGTMRRCVVQLVICSAIVHSAPKNKSKCTSGENPQHIRV